MNQRPTAATNTARTASFTRQARMNERAPMRAASCSQVLVKVQALREPLVPQEGLEPPRPRGHWILSPARLPFHHWGSQEAAHHSVGRSGVNAPLTGHRQHALLLLGAQQMLAEERQHCGIEVLMERDAVETRSIDADPRKFLHLRRRARG